MCAGPRVAESQDVRRGAFSPTSANFAIENFISKLGRSADVHQADESSWPAAVSTLPANVRVVCDKFIAQRNLLRLQITVAATFLNAVQIFIALSGPHGRSWPKEALLAGCVLCITMNVLIVAWLYPSVQRPKDVPVWVDCAVQALLTASMAQLRDNSQETDPTCAPTPMMALEPLLRKMLMMRYYGSMAVILLVILYRWERTRGWGTYRTVESVFISFRICVLLVLRAFVSPASTLYPPGQLPFSSALAVDVYMLLLWAVMTPGVRQRLSSLVPGMSHIQTDLASLSHLASTIPHEVTAKLGKNKDCSSSGCHLNSMSSRAHASMDTATVVTSAAHMPDILDYYR